MCGTYLLSKEQCILVLEIPTKSERTFKKLFGLSVNFLSQSQHCESKLNFPEQVQMRKLVNFLETLLIFFFFFLSHIDTRWRGFIPSFFTKTKKLLA